MTKFTKLAIMGSTVIFITVGFIAAGAAVATFTKKSPNQKDQTVQKETVIVEKKVYIKADTVKVPILCKRQHCDLDAKPKPKQLDDSTILIQTTHQ